MAGEPSHDGTSRNSRRRSLPPNNYERAYFETSIVAITPSDTPDFLSAIRPSGEMSKAVGLDLILRIMTSSDKPACAIAVMSVLVNGRDSEAFTGCDLVATAEVVSEVGAAEG